jgi:hypothetical protein
VSAPDDTLLGAFLRDARARCPRCRYSLHGCGAAQCPECGLPLRLALAETQTVTAWWLMAMFGPATCVLLCLQLLHPMVAKVQNLLADPRLVVVFRAGATPASELPDWGRTALGLALLLACGALLALAAGGRARLARMHPPLRAILALCLLATPLLLLALLRVYTHVAA